ncbi:hypothetical protein FDP41_000340 [Naegleria fowleri]|uniref:RCC1-like domain-containing protein n=1 Tax=Naegleria fowleri TaxID=5763 RepID=A0A6A5CB01_NAEFO|nr:uncharacterized protein FDP41_000340 [Naegleria fowleri]KAF0984441.1 hypothetical protein FDP41_000340 [Naegleria fowleri]CAG4718726.1 unnamed protein product [Naegleria fowleri]
MNTPTKTDIPFSRPRSGSSSSSSSISQDYDFAKLSFRDSFSLKYGLRGMEGVLGTGQLMPCSTATLEQLPERIFLSGSTSRFCVQSMSCTSWITPKELSDHVKADQESKRPKPIATTPNGTGSSVSVFSDAAQSNSPRSTVSLFPFDPKELISIDCGYNVTFYMTKTGLYATGSNSVGELGVGHSNEVRDHVEPVALPKLPLTPSYYIKKLVSGEGHTVVLMSTGEIIVWGKNGDGQIGCEKSVGEGTPRIIPSSVFGGEKIKQVACGYYHTLCLTESGIVYACGRNVQNQIGCVPNHVNVSSGFRPVTVLKEGGLCNDGGKGLKIVKIVAGSHHSLFLTEDGIVYAAGDNQFNAIGKKYPVFAPLEPFYSNNQATSNDLSSEVKKSIPYRYVKNVWCGSLSTFIQTREDKVFVCGTANDRALFLDEQFVNGNSNYVTDGFVLCDFLSGKQIRDIVGFYSMIAVSETRDVYVCGNNSCKQLTAKDQPVYNIRPQHEPFISAKLKQYPHLDYCVSAGFRTCSFYLYSKEKRTRNLNEFYCNLYRSAFYEDEESNNSFSDISIVMRDDEDSDEDVIMYDV